MKRTLATTILAAALLAPATGSAETMAASEVSNDTEDREPNFDVLDFDLLVSAGFGAFLYPHVEPGLDVGLIPIGQEMVVSIGGGVDFGWCALCSVIDLASDLDIKSSYWGPRIHANLHVGTIFGLLDSTMEKFTLDPFIGLWGGPTIYTFELRTPDGTSFETTQTTAIFGPALGLRLGMANNTFLVFGEYRWGTEVGFSTVNVEDESGDTTYTATDEISGKGNDFVVGIGLRI